MSNRSTGRFAALIGEIEAHKNWIIDTANSQLLGVGVTGHEIFTHMIAQVETDGWLAGYWSRSDGRLSHTQAALAKALQLAIQDRQMRSRKRSASHGDQSAAFCGLVSALDQLSTEELSPDNPILQLSIGDIRLLVTAVEEDSGRFQVGLHLNPFPASIADLANVGLALRAASGSLYAAVLDDSGSAAFYGVPPGIWHIQAIPPMPGTADRAIVSLPALRPGSDTISAAEDRYALQTPAGVAFVVTEPAPGVFELDITSPADGPRLIGLHYQTTEAEQRTLYVPVDSSRAGPPASRVRLDDISPTASWAAEDAVDIATPGMRDAEILERSIQAAGDKGTLRAWRSLARTAPDVIGEVLRNALSLRTASASRTRTESAASEPGGTLRSARSLSDPAAPLPHPSLIRAAEPAEEPSPRRFLTADLPARAPIGDVVSLLVRVTTDSDHRRFRAHGPVKPFAVPASGAEVLVVVEASPGLLPLDRLERVLTVPAEGDSEPIRFPLELRKQGLLTARVTAWRGARCVGEISLEISAERGAPVVPGRPRQAGLDRAGPGSVEAALLVRHGSNGSYSFQLLSNSIYYNPVVDSLGTDYGDAIERTLAKLEEFATGSTSYSNETASMSLKEIGVGLWRELVPGVIKEQFWELRGQITALSIATNHDIVPWELLYPFSGENDYGFLVEQVPVVRRVYGQHRTLRISVRDAAFVLPQDSPSFAHEEITSINRILRDVYSMDRAEIISRLEPLKSWIDSGQAGLLHFASHNQFLPARGGSSITMPDGDFLPMMLNSSVEAAVLSRHPLVFINACRSAGAAYGYTQPMSWASQFMAAGAGAFIGTLWAIPSVTANKFSEVFYDVFLRERLSFGAAVTAARLAIRSDNDPSWLAYTAYSDPDALCEDSASSP